MTDSKMTLYDYFRSSAAYRVRIVLNLKGKPYEQQSVHLVHGAQRAPEYLTLNPQGLVPTLVNRGRALTQSLAIIEYLEEAYPNPPLLPKTLEERARVRALANLIACEIHPLDNLRVKEYVTKVLGHTDEEWMTWYHHFIHEGFKPLEILLAEDKETGIFCHGESPTVADVCLVPQVFNARRFSVDLSAYPTIRRINDACLVLPAFQQAAPEKPPRTK